MDMHKDGQANLHFSFLLEAVLARKFSFYMLLQVCCFDFALGPYYYMTILLTLATGSTKFMVSNWYYAWHLTLLRCIPNMFSIVRLMGGLSTELLHTAYSQTEPVSFLLSVSNIC